MTRDVVNVLRFKAGGLAAAFSADCVVDVVDATVAAPHIRALLGLGAGSESAPQKTVRVRHGGRTIAIAVDPPVTISTLCRQDIRPVRGLDAARFAEYLLGFARCGSELIALVDLDTVLRRLDSSSEDR